MKGHTHETLQMWIATRSIDTEILYIILHNLLTIGERSRKPCQRLYKKIQYIFELRYTVFCFIGNIYILLYIILNIQQHILTKTK